MRLYPLLRTSGWNVWGISADTGMYRFVLLGGAILVANAYEYRMAIEDDDIKDREHWTAVSRDWYARASDRNPRVGRFYHHLAILARPNVLQQLFFYGKSLVAPMSFPPARKSIMTLFEPLLKVGSVLSRFGSKNSSRNQGTAFRLHIFSHLFIFIMCRFLHFV